YVNGVQVASYSERAGRTYYVNNITGSSTSDGRSSQALKLAGKFTGASIDKWVKSGSFSDLISEEGGAANLSATEQKGSGWYNQALTGNKLIEDKLKAGLKIRPKAVALYAEAIDDATGNVNKQLLRSILDQDEINFFDAANLIVDPVVRQSTGAAVKTFEFLLWFNTLIPQSSDPEEELQKSFDRGRVIAGLRIAAGEGAAIVDQLHADIPTPDFTTPSTDAPPPPEGFTLDE
ncbi:hypothetical protein LCGC14_2773150, partial [marine sediment metagenome]